MLRSPAPFPFTGAEAFVRKTGEKVRILRDNRDGTRLVAFSGTRAIPQLGRIASGNCSLPMRDLFATEAEALKGRRARRRKAA